LIAPAAALCLAAAGCGAVSYSVDLRTLVPGSDGTIEVADLAGLSVYAKAPANAVLRYTASGKGLRGTVAVLALNGSTVAEIALDGKESGDKSVPVQLDLREGDNTLMLCTVVTGKIGGPVSSCSLLVQSEGRQNVIEADFRTNLNAERLERTWKVTAKSK
jgi:hypothetical protein